MNRSALLHWVSFLLGVGAGGLVGGIQIEGNNSMVARIILLAVVILIGLGWAVAITGGEHNE